MNKLENLIGSYARLKCRHCISSNHCREYTMKCKILKFMENRKVKIRVYGERDWAREDVKDKSYIRYVNINRIIKTEV